jgi:NAD-dependent aldehyde dehydrogenases
MTLQLGQPDLLRQTAYLNGEWCEADSGARTEIFNPATGELIGAVPNMGRAKPAGPSKPRRQSSRPGAR